MAAAPRLRRGVERRPRLGGGRCGSASWRCPDTSSGSSCPAAAIRSDEADARLVADALRAARPCRSTSSAPTRRGRPGPRGGRGAAPRDAAGARARCLLARAARQRQAPPAHDGVLLRRQLDQLPRRRNRQQERAHDWLLHEARRRRRRSPAYRPSAQERREGARASARCAAVRSSTKRRAPGCGWARPTKRRWASAMRISNAT